MFNNPNTIVLEILVLIGVIIFVGILLGRYIYKRIHHLPVGDCAYCQNKSKKLLKEYHKKYGCSKCQSN